MSSREFVNNLAHIAKFDRNMLKALYTSIKQTPFHYQQSSIAPVDPRDKHVRSNGSVRLSRATSMKSSTGVLINPDEQIDYKHGWLLKKVRLPLSDIIIQRMNVLSYSRNTTRMGGEVSHLQSVVWG